MTARSTRLDAEHGCMFPGSDMSTTYLFILVGLVIVIIVEVEVLAACQLYDNKTTAAVDASVSCVFLMAYTQEYIICTLFFLLYPTESRNYAMIRSFYDPRFLHS